MSHQIAVETANAVTLSLSLDHGDTMVSPKPEPRSIRMKVNVDAAKAPAMMIGMEIPSTQSRMPRPVICPL